jgi:HD-like signal output (HDOD) protein
LEKVARVVGSEPALAARLVRIANSASLNPSGKPIGDLRTAINRMGYNMVRTASMSFAMTQIRRSDQLVAVNQDLEELWQRSIVVAAFAFVLARDEPDINADGAMLTGMMHGIGKLYILTRLPEHPELFRSTAEFHEIVAAWHPQIGKAILENWDFTEDMVRAVADQSDLDREGDEPADLSDVIAVAVLMASFVSDPIGLRIALQGLPATARLGLDETKTAAVMQQFESEVRELRQALGT